jgi:RNA-binding protein YlmH
MVNDKEALIICNHFRDLARQASLKNQYLYSSFLGLREQDLFYRIAREFGEHQVEVFGGTDGAERVMVRFGDVNVIGYSEPYPIDCVCVKAKQQKFADDLSHRDFLGALMHLGIERKTIGDIGVNEKAAYILCVSSVTDLICDELTRARHTEVHCERCDLALATFVHHVESSQIQVSSNRADAICAKVLGLSRNEASAAFAKGRVFVNGQMTENNSKLLQPGDKVTVRGFGRFDYEGILRETKKEKLVVAIRRYM